ncbi:3-keto-5-aminohexanoate cleavage protein [Deltaproteobacteria bacterium PRO3]|nr:3-keto-5-aminohexanoate cleavage protein [Deltaproteobacteria bacterium PRO3]
MEDRRRRVFEDLPELDRSVSRKPVIITCALTGVLAKKEQCPAIPYSPVEIAEEARRAYEAGAAVVHIHARTPEGGPSWESAVFGEIKAEIRKRCPVILNFSSGGIGLPIQERTRHIADHRPEIAALNMGSMNYAIYSRKNKAFYHDYVFANPFKDIQYCLERIEEAGAKPELECFDVGHIGNALPFIDMGLLKTPAHFSLILGVLGGISTRAGNLACMAANLPEGSHWEVIGIGRDQWRLLGEALDLGGDLRVGLEDNFYLPNGEMAASNGDLVRAAVRLVEARGTKPASVAEARAILALS